MFAYNYTHTTVRNGAITAIVIITITKTITIIVNKIIIKR